MRFMKKVWQLSIVAVTISASTTFAFKNLPITNGMKIHFVGNSLTGGDKATGVSGLPTRVLEATKQCTPPINFTFTVNLEWNKDLEYHYKDTTSAGAYKTIRNSKNDIVVLQGFGPDLNANGEKFFQYARLFYQAIDSSGAQGVFYMRNAYNPILYDKSTSKPKMNIDTFKVQSANLIANYNKIGKELGMPVIPVGELFYSLTMDPPTNLKWKYYNYLFDGREVQTTSDGTKYMDNIHQSDLGKLVTALCFYTALTGKSGIGLNLSFKEFVDNSPLLEGQTRREIIDTFAKRVFDIISKRDDFVGKSSGTILSQGRAQTVQNRTLATVTLLNGKTVRKAPSQAATVLVDGKRVYLQKIVR